MNTSNRQSNQLASHSVEPSVSSSQGSCNISILPDWTLHAQPDSHLWNAVPAVGVTDVCYANDLNCSKSGPKRMCAVCRVVCHVDCQETLQLACRPTYRSWAGPMDSRKQFSNPVTTLHHWVRRRRHGDKCKCCSKLLNPMFPILPSKDTTAWQCSWCKEIYHDRPECFPERYFEEECSMGPHAELIVPPKWITKTTSCVEQSSSVIRRISSFHASSTDEQKKTVREPIPTSNSRPEFASELEKPGSIVDFTQRSIASTENANCSQNSLTPVNYVPFVILPPSAPIPSRLRASTGSNSGRNPLVIFLNPKSGGNQGLTLLHKFQWVLNPRQVFDISRGGPRMGLELFGHVRNLRILVCGGDGSVGWILSTIDELKLKPSPPVAILPLGTGNDLARTLGWGNAYKDQSIGKILAYVKSADVVRLDRWCVASHIRANQADNISPVLDQNQNDADYVEWSKESAQPIQSPDPLQLANVQLPLKVFNNYFSLGADAATALEFHESREANPEKFKSRLKNKMFYAGCGGKDLVLRTWRDLSEHITLVCDDKDYTPFIRNLRPHVILFLNIPRYGSGSRPWGRPSATVQYVPQRFDDGYLEVIALSSMTLAALQVGGHGDRICQCRTAQITTKIIIPVQMDGEPCRLLPSTIQIHRLHQTKMLRKQLEMYKSDRKHHRMAVRRSYSAGNKNLVE